jgi:hypothetical protein
LLAQIFVAEQIRLVELENDREHKFSIEKKEFFMRDQISFSGEKMRKYFWRLENWKVDPLAIFIGVCENSLCLHVNTMVKCIFFCFSWEIFSSTLKRSRENEMKWKKFERANEIKKQFENLSFSNFFRIFQQVLSIVAIVEVITS